MGNIISDYGDMIKYAIIFIISLPFLYLAYIIIFGITLINNPILAYALSIIKKDNKKDNKKEPEQEYLANFANNLKSFLH